MNPSQAIQMMADAMATLAAGGAMLSPVDLAQHAEHLATMAKAVGKAEIAAARAFRSLDELANDAREEMAAMDAAPSNVIRFPSRHVGHDWTRPQGIVS